MNTVEDESSGGPGVNKSKIIFTGRWKSEKCGLLVNGVYVDAESGRAVIADPSGDLVLDFFVGDGGSCSLTMDGEICHGQISEDCLSIQWGENLENDLWKKESVSEPKKEKPALEVTRRRLSVGQSSPTPQGSMLDEAEDTRGSIQGLFEQSIVELMESPGRAAYIGADAAVQGRQSFASKNTMTAGVEIDPSSLGIGYTCRKGLKPESPNQDSWFVIEVAGDISMYGVLDGHGQKGHDISHFVKETLPKLIVQDPRFKSRIDMEDACKECFQKVQALVASASHLNASMSGTTATIVIHDHRSSKITVAHVGDCTAVIGTAAAGKEFKPGSDINGTALTRDHKPDLADERQRIEKAGGRVIFDGYANHRVYAKNGRYPGLNMSRCLGDLLGHADAGLSCLPEVSVRKLEPEDKVLILCSDGVWEFISPLEAAQMVAEFEPANCMMAAEKLAKEAWDRWIREEGGAVVDDITVLLIYLSMTPRLVTCDATVGESEVKVNCVNMAGEQIAILHFPLPEGSEAPIISVLKDALSEQLGESSKRLRVVTQNAQVVSDSDSITSLAR